MPVLEFLQIKLKKKPKLLVLAFLKVKIKKMPGLVLVLAFLYVKIFKKNAKTISSSIFTSEIEKKH
jgi:hypothetical protein